MLCCGPRPSLCEEHALQRNHSIGQVVIVCKKIRPD